MLKHKKEYMSFEIKELPGVCGKVTSEVMALHEGLMVEVRDHSILDITTDKKHLNRPSK